MKIRNSKKILWFTWKDRKNPLAGGAELVNEELAKRLVKDGKEVIFIVAGFRGCKREEFVDGYKVIRVGNRWTVYWEAFNYYKKYLKNWPDFIIEEINTIPFFTKFYVKQENILFIHQLCREIWFYQMFFPFSLIGYLLEPIYLWFLNDRKVVTVSESSKKDLLRFGFKKDRIHIIPEGIDLEPVKDVSRVEKYNKPTLISFGAVRAMKRTGHIIKAFELAKKEVPDLQLIIAGDHSGNFGRKIKSMVKSSIYNKDIRLLGKVDKHKKYELMQKAHLLVVTSVKEGWCLVVTEANSQGTPAVVYDVDGLRDSVRHEETGIVCVKNNPTVLSMEIIQLFNNKQKYERLRTNSWYLGKELLFDNTNNGFLNV